MRRVYTPAVGDCQSDWVWTTPTSTAKTMVEPEPGAPRWSGLYDNAGRPLMVHVERQAPGFVQLKERG